MSLEFAEKVRGIRESLGLDRHQFADLLDISFGAVRDWEETRKEPDHCWERVLQFIIDCPSSAVATLSKRPWIDETRDWSERVKDLLGRLDWTYERLGEFASVAPNSVVNWVGGIKKNLLTCHQISLSLLEIYADVDPKEWPPAIYLPEEDIITPERIKLLRQSLAMRQRDLANLIHMKNTHSWETGSAKPGWCANLLLRIIETFPRAVDLLGKIPWGDQSLSPARAIEIRSVLGFTTLEFSRLLGASQPTIHNYEYGRNKPSSCAVLVYQLLEQHPKEFLSYAEGLSNPGGQACPIW
jgi:DNA-binding transcriptional regulator YiaG